MGEHPVAGREGGVAFGGLNAAVGHAVTPHHLRRAVAEQVLDIEFARVVGDRPGGEGVAEAMRVDPPDAGGAAEPAQSRPEPTRLEADAVIEVSVARRDEEWAACRPPVGEVRGSASAHRPAKGTTRVLAALAVPDAQAALW